MWKYFYLGWLTLTFAGPLWLLFTGQVNMSIDYRHANRDSAHIAPTPAQAPEAIIQVYSARAFSWRGIFASHCWIAVKEKNADAYTVYQVVGWLTYQGLPSLSVMQDIPDRNWYNAAPKLLLDLRGQKAETLIPKIIAAAKTYPYAGGYTLWPGPNSNTFPAYVARKIPELGLAMPPDALGKDYLSSSNFFAPAPSGTGYQLSLWGIAGIMLAKKEGIEINFLGMVYGIKFSPFGIILPGVD